jgi:hypothetical protein
MATFVISVLVVIVGIALSYQFYQWVRRAQGTFDDDPYDDHFDFEEWSRAAQEDYDAMNADFETVADDFPPIAKYEGAKKTRARVRKAVTKKTAVKKTAPKKGGKKMTPKKVRRG